MRASEVAAGLSRWAWTLCERVSRNSAGHRSTGRAIWKGLSTLVFQGKMLLDRKSLVSSQAGGRHGGRGGRKHPDLRRAAFSSVGFAVS